jgi:hypothetical protein
MANALRAVRYEIIPFSKNFCCLTHYQTRVYMRRQPRKNGTRKRRKRVIGNSDKMGYKYVTSLGREQPLQKMHKRG